MHLGDCTAAVGGINSHMDGGKDGDDAVIGGGGDADGCTQARACAMRAVVGEAERCATLHRLVI